MKNTFVCDETIMITIPIGRLKDAQRVQVMPEEFRCVYRDTFKVFTYNGKPKPLGVSQSFYYKGLPFFMFCILL